jgi:hypothetical protein
MRKRASSRRPLLFPASCLLGAISGFRFPMVYRGWPWRPDRRCLGAIAPRSSAQFSTMSNECVSSAVFASMIDAEQYLSADRLIARSTVAGFKFLPVTVK